MWSAWFAIPFWQRVLGAFVLGISIGLLDADFAQQLKPLGDLFIKAISMIVAPLIFCAIVSAIVQLQGKQGAAALATKDHWLVFADCGDRQYHWFNHR
jgi:uncharacterized protein